MFQKCLPTYLFISFILFSCVFLVANSPDNVEQVRRKVERTVKDLRSLSVGIETYKLDYFVYPDSMQILGDSIYMVGIPPDPFSSDPNSSNTLKMNIVGDPDGDKSFKFLIYGNGPDGDDDKGYIEYDSANGLISDGDIIRVISETDFPPGFIHKNSREKYLDLKQTLDEQNHAMMSYALLNRKLPERFEDLMNPIAYIDETPIDPFNPDSSLRLKIESEDSYSTTVIYSVGYDGDDDGGIHHARLHRKNDIHAPEGDICLFFSCSDYLQRINPDEYHDNYSEEIFILRTELEKRRDEFGEENTLLYLLDAITVVPDKYNNFEQEVMKEMLCGNMANKNYLIGYLSLWDNCVSRLRSAVESGNPIGPGFTGASGVNNLATRIREASAVIAVNAMIENENGNYEKAIDYAILNIRLGTHLQCEDVMPWVHSMGYATTVNGIRVLLAVLEDYDLGKNELEKILSAILHAEESRVALHKAYEFEMRNEMKLIEEESKRPESLVILNNFLKREGYAELTNYPEINEIHQFIYTGYTNLRNELKVPYYQRFSDKEMFPDTKRFEYKPLMDYFTNRAGSWEIVSLHEYSQNMNSVLLKTAVLITLYKMNEGKYPLALDVFENEYDIISPESGKSLNYVHKDNSFVIHGDTEWFIDDGSDLVEEYMFMEILSLSENGFDDTQRGIPEPEKYYVDRFPRDPGYDCESVLMSENAL